MKSELSKIIKDNKVYFSRYRKGFLYYHIKYNGGIWEFTVPTSDIGDATFLNEDKAIMFMRYIRKAIEDSEFVRVGDIDDPACYSYTSIEESSVEFGSLVDYNE